MKTMSRFLPQLLPLLLCWCAGAAMAQVTPVADFSAGPGSGVFSYASTSPTTVTDLIQRGRPRLAVTVQAQLRLPPGTPAATSPATATVNKWPAVVLVQGSGGVYPELVTFWARRFNEQGIAALVIDVFGPRGVKSTAEDLGQVPFAADTADAFAALGLLASLFVHGDADDYTYLGDCRRYAERLAAAGTPTEVVALPGARHKFDSDDQRRIDLRWVVKTKQGCPLGFDVTRRSLRHSVTGEAVPQAQAADLLRELCADKGATLEGGTQSREAAAQAVLAFLNKVLKP